MNFGLPDSTLFDRRVPKQKFYENLPITAALKRSFVDEIVSIRWRNKFAATTLNLAKGATVTEIEVFEIELTGERLNEDVLRQMDSLIPYHLLFVLSNAGRVSAWIGYKEATSTGEKAFKVSRYYRTDWMPRESLRLTLSGLDMDAVYEGLVRQIAAAQRGMRSEEQGAWKAECGLAENVAWDAERERIAKRIVELEAKRRKERQLNRQMEINAQIKRLRAELGIENEE